MDLRSGFPLWLARGTKDHASPTSLATDATCDVAVLGAGVTGALVAHQCVSAGLDTIVLDRRPAGAGSTSASTALLLYETDTSLPDLIERHGRRAAERVYQLGAHAIEALGTLVRTMGIDCDFQEKPSLRVASTVDGYGKLQAEFAAQRHAGLSPALLPPMTVVRDFDLEFHGALYTPRAAQLDPFRLTRGLLNHHRRENRLRVFDGTDVTTIIPHRDHVELRTEGGATVWANKVAIAPGYEAAPLLDAALVHLHSTYVIASAPLGRLPFWKDDCLIWETARPYFYLRTTAEGRIVIGGEDEPFQDPDRRDALLGRKRLRLEQRFRKLFPMVVFVTEYAWTSTFAETPDGLPYIGASERSPHIYYALGYGGNGITFGQIAAEIIRDLCTGHRNADATLFSFTRVKKSAPKLRRRFAVQV